MPQRVLRTCLAAVALALSISLSPHVAAQAAPHVRLTWVAVTTWLLEIGDTRLLLDAYFSRPSAPLFLPGSGGAYTFEPKPSDRATVEQMLAALKIGPGSLDYILSGHSHYDHSLDIPLVAEITGAKVIGPQSTCLQMQAEGLPLNQCTAVNGGEAFTLNDAKNAKTVVHVIHSDHSGNETSILHVPRELTMVPTVIPPTTAGGLHVGVLEDMPNGGGTRVYLITVDGPGRKTFSIALETSGSSTDFENAIAVRNCIGVYPVPACDVDTPGPIYLSPGDSFRSAMQAAGLSNVDLFIGFATGNPGPSDLSLKQQEFAILHPRFFIPTHLGGLGQPITGGLDAPFQPSAGFLDLLADEHTTLVNPGQFMDTFILDAKGVTATPNHAVKRSLGLPDVQTFPNQ
jgi:L-ascorbate metabolism protein UlaG (beta-lactamase superfamily)